MTSNIQQHSFYKETTFEDLQGEKWIDVPEFEGSYLISNYGRVKSIERLIITKAGYEVLIKGRILKQTISKKLGEPTVNLSIENIKTNFRTAKLVQLGFMREKRHGEVICHLNKNKLDNRLINLAIKTVSESKKINYNKGIMVNWGIDTIQKEQRFKYEKENGKFEKGKLIKIKCSICKELKDVSHFYSRKENKRRECKECIIKKAGVKELGKHKHHVKLANEGKRICSECKVEKDLYLDFHKNKNSYKGRTHLCKTCVKIRNKNYRKLSKIK